MSSLLRTITETIGGWFKNTAPPPMPTRKFEIERTTETPASDPPQRSGKTFDITDERSGGAATAHPPSRFTLYGGTMPKRCPYCGTQDSVTRGSRRRWKCKVCDSQWR